MLKLKMLFYIGTISTLLLAAAACGGDDDDGGSSPTQSETSTPRASRQVDFPEGYPEEFPLYPGAIYEQGSRHEQAVLVQFTSPDGLSEIAGFYRERLQAEPWRLVSEAAIRSGQTLSLVFRHEIDPLNQRANGVLEAKQNHLRDEIVKKRRAE